MRMTLVPRLNGKIKTDADGWSEPARDRFVASNYIAVPTIKVHGSWKIMDMLPMETLAGLFRLEKEVKGQ